MIRLENVLKISFQEVLKTSSKRLEDVLARRLEDVWPRRIYWSWPRRLEDVFWRRMAKANMFVLIHTSKDVLKMSSEDEDERGLQDVFKTSSSRQMFGGILLKWPLQHSRLTIWKEGIWFTCLDEWQDIHISFIKNFIKFCFIFY